MGIFGSRTSEALLVLVVLLTACGGARTAGQESGATPHRLVAANRDFVDFDDPTVGVSGRYPAGWDRARALTEQSDPREVLALATYPLRDGAVAGECAPDTARADMPPDGTFIWLLEYQPAGGFGVDLPRDRFPPKPERFELGRSDFSDENLWCFSGFGYTTTFRAAERPFQLLVTFGGQPTDEGLADVERVLDSLQFQSLPGAG